MKQTTRAACIPLLLTCAGHAADVRYGTIAASGSPAPGLAGLTFDVVADPRLNESRHSAFWAQLAGPGVTAANDGSLWTDRSGSLALVAREGDAAPFAVDIRWGSFGAVAFNDQSRFALTASLVDNAAPTAPTRLGVFREFLPGPGFEVIAVEGSPAPVIGTNFETIAPGPFNAAGHQAFISNGGLTAWSTRAGSLAPLLQALSIAPSPGGGFLGRMNIPAQDAAGRVAIFATMHASMNLTTQPSYYALFTHAPGATQPTPLAATGQATPLSTAIDFKDVDAHADFGRAPGSTIRVGFWGSMQDGGVTALNDTAIWLQPPAQGVSLVREGSAATAAGPGIFFASFGRAVSITDVPSGRAVFSATLLGNGVSNQNNASIWYLDPQQTQPLALLAREGAQVPRLPAGVVYSWLGEPVLTASGHVAFMARVAGPGVTVMNSTVLMATATPTGFGLLSLITPVVRTGDFFPVAPGDTRQVHEITFDPGHPAAGNSAITADGVLALKLAFKSPFLPSYWTHMNPPYPPGVTPQYTHALVTAKVRCILIDLNGDGALSIADFAAFQTAYVLGDVHTADFNGSGTLSVADFAAFQAAFTAGCP